MELKRAWLTTNRSCNNHCKWCYAQNAIGQDMDYEEALHCIDVLADIGITTIVLIGGEPTLYEHVDKIINYIKHKNLRAAMTTNGRKFADYDFAKQIVDLGVDSINISLKAPTEKKYLERTGACGLSEAIQGYHNLEKCGFRASLSYVICSNDKQEITELIESLHANKLENMLFQFAKPVIEKNSKEVLSVQEMAEMVEFIYCQMKTRFVPYMFELSFPFCTIKASILSRLMEEKRITSCCHVQSQKGIVVDTDFTVLPCNHFVGRPYSSTLRADSKKSIEDIFSLETALSFRRVARRYPSQKCINCKMWDACGGGCFTRWFFTDPMSCIPGFKE